MNDEYNPSEKAVKIVEKIKEMTGIPAIFIDRKPNTAEPSLTDSKFGGLPYWDLEKEYPTDSKGRKMMLLAQINFSDLSAFDTVLPKEGMLQFFITIDDDVFGMDFDEPTSQKDFRVVFHDMVKPDVTEAQVQALEIVRAEEADDYGTPIFRQAALSFRAGTDYMGTSMAEFPSVFVQAVKAVTGEEIDVENWYEYYEEDSEDYDYMEEELSGLGHKILGYPGFIQSDPREDDEALQWYDTLLLQIDSDMENGEDYVLWGDCGVANLFINKEALIKRDFGKVLYNWDCS